MLAWTNFLITSKVTNKLSVKFQLIDQNRDFFVHFISMNKKIKLGPGMLVTAAFVGPGTVTACAKAGITFGYSLLWALIISILITMLFQEMAARIGIVTQSGLASVIRKELSSPVVRLLVTILILAAILVGNIAYEAGNLNGAVLGLESIFGSEYSGVYPWVVGVLALLLILIGSMKLLKNMNILIALVLLMSLSFIMVAVATAPSIVQFLKGMFVPQPNSDNFFTILALIGTTVVPYNLFLHASLAANTWKDVSGLKASRKDTIWAVGLGGIISMAILVVAVAIPGGAFNSVLDLSKGLEPLFGSSSKIVIGLGLFAAGLTSALTAPIAAAFVVTNCMNDQVSSDSLKFKMIAVLVLLVGTLFLGTSYNPIEIILFAQAANGALLPILAFLIVWMAQRKSVLGDYTNSRVQQIVGYSIIAFCLLLSYKTVVTLLG